MLSDTGAALAKAAGDHVAACMLYCTPHTYGCPSIRVAGIMAPSAQRGLPDCEVCHLLLMTEVPVMCAHQVPTMSKAQSAETQSQCLWQQIAMGSAADQVAQCCRTRL